MDEFRQEKPWEELSEEERQEIRESWKIKLPEKFDVFCDGSWEFGGYENLHIPGNLYVSGALRVFYFDHHEFDLTTIVDGNFIVDGTIDTLSIIVGGDFISGSDVDVLNLTVDNNLFIPGSLTALGMHIGGDVFIDGDLVSNEDIARDTINICGDMVANGDLFCHNIHVYGNFSFDGTKIDCHDMYVYGAFSVANGINLNTNEHPLLIGMPPFFKDE